jgi:hypothetical protein
MQGSATRIVLRCMCLAGAVVAGCSSEKVAPVGEVDGVVTLDGKPLERARIEFHPNPADGVSGLRSTAETDHEGRFSLKCDDGRAGAVVAEHRVTVHDLLQYEGIKAESKHSPDYGSGELRPPPRARFPDTFSDLGRTPLRKKVKIGKQTIDVELKSRP